MSVYDGNNDNNQKISNEVVERATGPSAPSKITTNLGAGFRVGPESSYDDFLEDDLQVLAPCNRKEQRKISQRDASWIGEVETPNSKVNDKASTMSTKGDRRRVTFYPYVSVRTMPNKANYTIKQKRLLWYTDTEYAAMVKHTRKLQHRLRQQEKSEKKGKNSAFDGSKKCLVVSRQRNQDNKSESNRTIRSQGNDINPPMSSHQDNVFKLKNKKIILNYFCCGVRTIKQEQKRKQHRIDALDAVLTEQDLQWDEEGMIYDPQMIADVYCNFTCGSQKEAQNRANLLFMQQLKAAASKASESPKLSSKTSSFITTNKLQYALPA